MEVLKPCGFWSLQMHYIYPIIDMVKLEEFCSDNYFRTTSFSFSFRTKTIEREREGESNK